MIQDIISYMIILYAIYFTICSLAGIFIPAREKVKKGTCSSCYGCNLKDSCQ